MDLSDVTWRKSSRSTSQGGECVELAEVPSIIAVRDSTDPQGPVLTFGHDAFRRFMDGIKNA
ncbi:DUF397 domain-containing protein [Actinomadura fulvescens]|uniref:DUF397 domain-containing protein n=1 Tax=Actinomadura fulvescens TaxID=46160 RepID=A0ABP6C653_9ACTN